MGAPAVRQGAGWAGYETQQEEGGNPRSGRWGRVGGSRAGASGGPGAGLPQPHVWARRRGKDWGLRSRAAARSARTARPAKAAGPESGAPQARAEIALRPRGAPGRARRLGGPTRPPGHKCKPKGARGGAAYLLAGGASRPYLRAVAGAACRAALYLIKLHHVGCARGGRPGRCAASVQGGSKQAVCKWVWMEQVVLSSRPNRRVQVGARGRAEEHRGPHDASSAPLHEGSPAPPPPLQRACGTLDCSLQPVLSSRGATALPAHVGHAAGGLPGRSRLSHAGQHPLQMAPVAAATACRPPLWPPPPPLPRSRRRQRWRPSLQHGRRAATRPGQRRWQRQQQQAGRRAHPPPAGALQLQDGQGAAGALGLACAQMPSPPL